MKTKKEKQFITFEEALELHRSMGVPIGKSTLYQMIREEKGLPVKKAYGRYLFDRERLIEFIKNILEN